MGLDDNNQGQPNPAQPPQPQPEPAPTPGANPELQAALAARGFTSVSDFVREFDNRTGSVTRLSQDLTRVNDAYEQLAARQAAYAQPQAPPTRDAYDDYYGEPQVPKQPPADDILLRVDERLSSMEQRIQQRDFARSMVAARDAIGHNEWDAAWPVIQRLMAMRPDLARQGWRALYDEATKLMSSEIDSLLDRRYGAGAAKAMEGFFQQRPQQADERAAAARFAGAAPPTRSTPPGVVQLTSDEEAAWKEWEHKRDEMADDPNVTTEQLADHIAKGPTLPQGS